jgi:hypothetical protein
MTGEQLIQQLENGTTPADSFHHVDHVRLAFEYLNRYPALAALEKFSAALKRFAAAQGKAQRYHETITWAYLLLIRERVARAARTEDLGRICQAQPRLAHLEGRRSGESLQTGDP